MSEEPDNAAPEETIPAATPAPDVPAAEHEAAPPAAAGAEQAAEATPVEPPAAKDETPDMPDFFAKLQSKIPDKLVPPTLKMDGLVARKAAFWVTLAGALISNVAMYPTEGYNGVDPGEYSSASGYFGAVLGLVGLWFSLIAIKKIKRISKQLAVCVTVVAVVACTTAISGCGAASTAGKGAALGKRTQQSLSAFKTFAESANADKGSK